MGLIDILTEEQMEYVNELAEKAKENRKNGHGNYCVFVNDPKFEGLSNDQFNRIQDYIQEYSGIHVILVVW